MNRVLRYIFIVVFIGCFANLKSQQANFSQSYSNPMYLSPSFTGLVDGTRFSLVYRDQWPSIPNTYKTTSFSLDHYFSRFNSGAGFLFFRDDQGNGVLLDQTIALSYSYEVFIREDIMLRPGIQFKYSQIDINPSKLILRSQLDPTTGIPSSTGVSLVRDSKGNFDAAASLMIYSNFYWGGFSVDHLVKDPKGFTDIEGSDKLKINTFAGYKWVYKRGRRGSPDKSLSFAFNYYTQGGFSQLDIGSYWNVSPIELGLWYRGFPGNNAEGYRNTDAVICILGVTVGQLRVGYSYDLTVSNLIGNSGGTHEVSLMFTIPNNSRFRIRRNAIPCTQVGNAGMNDGYKYNVKKRKLF